MLQVYNEQKCVIDVKDMTAKFGVIDYSGLVDDNGFPYGIGRAIMHGSQIYEG